MIKIFKNIVPVELLDRLNAGLYDSIKICDKVRRQRNVYVEDNDGIAHHTLWHNDANLDLLKLIVKEFDDYLCEYFQSKYILNTFGGLSLASGGGSYVSNIHRDIRTFNTDLKLMINCMVLLDDFTENNGSTYIMNELYPHKTIERDLFFSKAKQVIAPKGSIVFFDSRLLHCAGQNNSAQDRKLITIAITKPFVKPQYNYCSEDKMSEILSLSQEMQSFLGLFSRIPNNLNDWYQPKEKRFYQSNQEQL